MALLSKETAVVFPTLLLLWHVVFGRAAPERGSRIVRAHHLAAWGTLASFLLAATLHARYGFLFTYALGLRGWVENLLSQAYAVTYAATLILAPAPWRLNFRSRPAPRDVGVAVAGAVVPRRDRGGLRAGGRRRATGAGLLVRPPVVRSPALAPTNSILPRYDLLSELTVDLPSIPGYSSRSSTGSRPAARASRPRCPRWAGAPRAARWLLPTAAVLLLAGITIDRNRLYADPVAFWADAVRKSPRKARPHTNYGYALYRAGQTDRAIREFRAALAIDPHDPDAPAQLGAARGAPKHDPTVAGRRE